MIRHTVTHDLPILPQDGRVLALQAQIAAMYEAVDARKKYKYYEMRMKDIEDLCANYIGQEFVKGTILKTIWAISRGEFEVET